MNQTGRNSGLVTSMAELARKLGYRDSGRVRFHISRLKLGLDCLTKHPIHVILPFVLENGETDFLELHQMGQNDLI